MRKTVIDLIECVRGLKLTRTERPSPYCVKIGLGPSEFPEKLADLQAALERVDAEGVLAGEIGDQQKLHSAIDAIFRWIKMQGLSIDEPMGILKEHVTGKREKKQKSFDMLPKFEPTQVGGKSGKWKPRLNIADNGRFATSIEGHRRNAAAMDEVAMKMGHTLPSPPPFEAPKEVGIPFVSRKS